MPPLLMIAIAWLIGLVAAHHWLVPLGVQPASLALLSLLPVAAFLLWREDRSMRLSSACALALFLAALRYQAAVPRLNSPGAVAYYNDRGWVTLQGLVRDYPDVRDTWTNLTVGAEWIEVEGQKVPVRGDVLVRAPRFPAYGYGDRLRVSGFLETPPELEGFSYRDYLARSGIYSTMGFPTIERIATGQGSPFWRALYAVRSQASGLLARLVPEPAASLMQGILLGVRGSIPAGLYDDFNATGTSHVIVISGTKDSLTQIVQLRCHPTPRSA
jgi:competence protein ComEC